MDRHCEGVVVSRLLRLTGIYALYAAGCVARSSQDAFLSTSD
jgi:hypothetical protein